MGRLLAPGSVGFMASRTFRHGILQAFQTVGSDSRRRGSTPSTSRSIFATQMEASPASDGKGTHAATSSREDVEESASVCLP